MSSSFRALGALCVAVSLSEVVGQPLQWHQQWFSLVGLTLVSGLLPVTLPNVNVSISISETFVVAGTLLFGTAGGTVLVLLDALVISMRLAWSRRLRWQQVVFNLAAPPLSIWTAAKLAGIQPLLDLSHLTPLPKWFIPELGSLHGRVLPAEQLADHVCTGTAEARSPAAHLVGPLQRTSGELRERRLDRCASCLQHQEDRPGLRCGHYPASDCPLLDLSDGQTSEWKRNGRRRRN